MAGSHGGTVPNKNSVSEAPSIFSLADSQWRRTWTGPQNFLTSFTGWSGELFRQFNIFAWRTRAIVVKQDWKLIHCQTNFFQYDEARVQLMLPQPLQTRVAKAILLNQHDNIMYDRVRLSTINYVIRMLSFDMGFLAQLVTLSVSQWVIFWFQHNDHND